MNKNQFEALRMVKPISDVLSIQHLRDKTPRTLLLGYDSDRMTIHTYICPSSGTIRTAIYGGYDNISLCEREIDTNEDYLDLKRVYPHRSDYEFLCLLKERGLNPAFGTFLDFKEEAFYGETL